MLHHHAGSDALDLDLNRVFAGDSAGVGAHHHEVAGVVEQRAADGFELSESSDIADVRSIGHCPDGLLTGLDGNGSREAAGDFLVGIEHFTVKDEELVIVEISVGGLGDGATVAHDREFQLGHLDGFGGDVLVTGLSGKFFVARNGAKGCGYCREKCNLSHNF